MLQSRNSLLKVVIEKLRTTFVRIVILDFDIITNYAADYKEKEILTKRISFECEITQL